MAKRVANKREASVGSLYEAMKTISVIECNKCGVRHTWEEDGYDSSFKAFESGWFATTRKVYCPECNQKRIKKSRKLYSPLV